ncbi:hypothetical protein [Bacteroides faecis]|uniref:hypothetical protein n=1 Tax=Bacteroides faecis TaxID=674529 RepID=UPI0039C87B78
MKILFAFLFFLLLSLETSYSCFNNDFPLLKREMYNQCTDIIIEAGQMCDSIDWKISSFLKAEEICSEITSLMDFSVEMRLVSDAVTGAGSTIDIYTFNGVQWKSFRTGNLFLQNGHIRTYFSPGETKKFCSGIIIGNSCLEGVAFIEYRIYYMTPLGKRMQKKEIVYSITPLKGENGSRVNKVYWCVDKKSEFPGGDEALEAFFKKKSEESSKEEDQWNNKGYSGRGWYHKFSLCNRGKYVRI